MKNDPISRIEALHYIVHRSRNERTNKACNKRVMRALVTLGFRGDDLLQAGYVMEIWKQDGTSYIAGAVSIVDAQNYIERIK